MAGASIFSESHPRRRGVWHFSAAETRRFEAAFAGTFLLTCLTPLFKLQRKDEEFVSSFPPIFISRNPLSMVLPEALACFSLRSLNLRLQFRLIVE